MCTRLPVALMVAWQLLSDACRCGLFMVRELIAEIADGVGVCRVVVTVLRCVMVLV